MTTCDLTQQAMLDGTHDAHGHLATCPSCRDFEAGHRSARGLAAITPVAGSRPRKRQILARGVLLVSTVVGLFALNAAREVDRFDAPLPALASETALRADSLADPHHEWARLVNLAHDVSSELHRDVATTDPTYTSFGALSQWVAPSSRLTALEN